MTPVNSPLDRLSARERLLALATSIVVALALVFMMASRAYSRVELLDRTIERLEDEVRNFAQMEARGVSVDRQFAKVAEQHSSAWTEAEIHNRLRSEIYRLARENPDDTGGPNLVEIPRLRQGKLEESEGYREYKLSIPIPQTDIYSLIIFLTRLQASPQALRIDGLEVSRSPEIQIVNATVNVTRTVVNGVAQGAEAIPAEDRGMEPLVSIGDSAEGWEAFDCELSVVTEVQGAVPDGGTCLKGAATAQGARLGWPHELTPGGTYRLSLDAVAAGKVRLEVTPRDGGKTYDGGEYLNTDGGAHRYTVEFTMPPSEDAVTMLAPQFVLETADAAVFVDNVSLERIGD